MNDETIRSTICSRKRNSRKGRYRTTVCSRFAVQPANASCIPKIPSSQRPMGHQRIGRNGTAAHSHFLRMKRKLAWDPARNSPACQVKLSRLRDELNYFRPRIRILAVNARLSKALNVRKLVDPITLFTTYGFRWLVMLSKPPRSAQWKPSASKRFSRCKFSEK